MNIKILDSWLRVYLKTKAAPHQIAEKLSLSSVSVERLEVFKGGDYIYDIEITTNRPDLMSVVGLAREAAVVLSENGIDAFFEPPKLSEPEIIKAAEKITIKNDPKLVNRICAVIMEVSVKPTPQVIIDRLESTGMRSLNNLIDVTNYVTRTIGHSTHVFDFDRLNSKQLMIRESKKGEQIMTLDKKTHLLPGGDIVAVNDSGQIVDLLGIMGLENSVVTNDTKRILYFLDNNDPVRMRRTSMTLNIRSDAVVLNEKDTDPELARDAFLYGIKLYEDLANGKVISDLIDIYPNKVKKMTISVSEEQISSVIGVSIPVKKSAEILSGLGFETKISGENILTTPPSFRAKDVQIPVDVIEEIARIYGYHNIPNSLPSIDSVTIGSLDRNEFHWERKIKEAFKYWGFTETYTYSMVSEELIAAKPGAELYPVRIKNPLSEEFVYMRGSLIPSMLSVVKENQDYETINIFEVANVYGNVPNKLPLQTLHLAAVMKKQNITFFDAKGVIEQICNDLGIKEFQFKVSAGSTGKDAAEILYDKTRIGEIQIVDANMVSFELNLELMFRYATAKKVYKSVSKFPSVIEDLAINAPEKVSTGTLIETIKSQSKLIKDVTLLDKFEDTRTFHIVYQSYEKNLTGEEVGVIREKILKTLKDKFDARIKA